MTTGSDHETLAWEVYMAQGQPPVEEARWKTRQPKDNDELEKWRKVWFASLLWRDPVTGFPEGNPLAGLPEGNPLASNLPIEGICEKFSESLTNTLGTKQICQRTKRWWTPVTPFARVEG
jgi:hypothetical protein